MMSAIIGTMIIGDNSGTITYGNTLNISSIRTEKSFHGSGGGNTGNVVIEMTGPSSTNTIDLTGVAASNRKHLNEARVRHSK
jgi:spore germination protein PF